MVQKDASQTPVMRQFFAAKAKHPGALLFFRMGDFYELFYDDAVIVSRALDLTLTSRNKGKEDEVPMAGVPHHAVAGYVQRLLDQGFRVAICEQLADPSKVKGIVPRDVVRVVSPGMVFDDGAIDARQNHFLAALTGDGAGKFGLAALDATTAELLTCEVADAAGALAELVRLDPRELLVSGDAARGIGASLEATRPRLFVRAIETSLAPAEITAVLDGVLGEGEATKACSSPLARAAAALALQVASGCEPGRALPVGRLVAYEPGDALILDEAAQAHLEIVRTFDGDSKGSLLAVVDATVTPAGARLLRRRLLSPRTDVTEIRRRLDAVELFVTQPGLRRIVRKELESVADLERLATKLTMDRASPRDLASLRSSLRSLPKIDAALRACGDVGAKSALSIDDDEPWIDVMTEATSLLGVALAEDPPARATDPGVLRSGFDAALDDSRGLLTSGQEKVAELEARLREDAQIPSLKLRYTRVFGWYIEVTRSHVGKAPAGWRRKQTIANGERYTCAELDALADGLLHAEERCAEREELLYKDLVHRLAEAVPRLRDVAARLAVFDVSSALAEIAHRDDYVRPHVDDSSLIEIEEGRHPVVEKLAAAGRFVPNDVVLDADPKGVQSRFWILTGPNMAGKSTLMRQVALTAILAQMGSFVPARRARIGVVDRVLTRVGASDNLARGDSTFMVEMKETAQVLRRASRRSLVVLDEIGRGTSTYDGLSIAWAVAEHLHDVVGCRALFATHYHELTELAASRKGCENWSVSAREHQGELVFLHRLQRGAASRSYGVACARLAGLPEPVLARARVLLSELERGGTAGTSAPQLSLFSRGKPPPPALDQERSPAEARALAALRSVDVDRLTPLDALAMLAKLRSELTMDEGGQPPA